MRSGGGNRVNPSASEFSSEFLKVYINELFTKIDGTNCELDPGDFLIKLDEMKINIPDKTFTSTQMILTEVTGLGYLP